MLCLILSSGEERTRKPRTAAVAEAFLRFSPRVQFREPNLLFIDVASTAHFFKRAGSTPEQGVLQCALQLAKELGFDARAAISDTPAGAQAFARLKQDFICRPGEEREELQPLSLPLLLHLEGLVPWQKPKAIEQIVTFFYMLGFEKIGDLERFTLTSFQDRWGEIGATLWRRVHGHDRQPISPLLPTEPLQEYVYLDFPITLTSLLLYQLRRSLQFLFARLQGRSLFARRLVLRLRCEYSDARHQMEIEPCSPSRDLGLFLTLLESKIDGIDLDNPIRDFEIEVVPCPERIQQLDFFEPRTTDQDKLASLFSLLRQSSVRIGRYALHDAIMPEHTWDLHTLEESPNVCQLSRSLEQPTGTAEARSGYGAAIVEAPRPTRILKNPRRLTIDELQKLHLLTEQPIERLEEGWWNHGDNRDYYFAVSPHGQCLWIFQDRREQEYYLHGYFD